jgi:dienelactone hydrolase
MAIQGGVLTSWARNTLVLFAISATIHALAQSTPPASLPPGQLLETVACYNDPTQSYSLYLPSAYAPGKPWPIIYAFDPLARGTVPVKLYKDLAEKYGYIVAASNNSRNFAMDAATKGINAMWQDTHLRLTLDERRVYTTGFSGGARVAGMVALSCPQCKIAGVMAYGAGYPMSQKPSPKDALLYFLAVGDQDFNWEEITMLRREREDLGQPYREVVFTGPHQWPPPEVITEAVKWIHLKAMQSGALRADAAFVEQEFDYRQAEASQAEKRADAIAQLSAYRALVSDFAGLKDVSEYISKLDALKKSAALKQSLKKEDEAIATQRSLTANISSQIAAAEKASPDERVDLRRDLLDAMTQLRSQSQHEKNDDKRVVLQRSFHDVWAQGIEAGQAQLADRHFDLAEFYFRLMADVTPDEPWPTLLLAETSTAAGNKKQAIKDLRETVKRGLKNPEAIEKDGALEALRGEAEYRKLIAELKAAKAGPN